ncbi:MAG: hypothetical protein IJ764_07270 [Bacteroidales bacterium]|nr:hypothetical protein [Bacteroidales bacterium]
MRLKLLLFSALSFMLSPLCLAQQGSGGFQTAVDSVTSVDSSNTASRQWFSHQVDYARHWWNSLFPSKFVMQNAGNMGFLSGGVGWGYGGRQQWETGMLMGWIPKHRSSSAKLTLTIKQSYIPWSQSIGKRWSVEPLRVGVYLNAVFGDQFWAEQPKRYPTSYYGFSTKFRVNVCFGQQVSCHFNLSDSHTPSIVFSFFYEFSTCDTYIMSKLKNSRVSWTDIIGLSLGIAVQF